MCTVRSGISSRFILLLAVLLLLSSTAYSQTIVNSSNLAEICPTGDCCELIDNSDPLGKTDSASHAFILRFKDTKKQIYRFLERTENGISKGVQKKFNSASNQVDAEVFNLWNSTWNGQFSRYAVLCESDDNFECIPKDTAQTRKDIRDGAYALAQETSFAKRIYLRAARKHKRAITARKLRTFKDLRNTPDKILAQMINVTDGETCVVPDPLPDPSPETSPVPDSAKPSPTPIVPVTPPPPPPAPPV
ncbi:MAG: hypothetical protein KDD56_10560, partial [Bdellovibrionales bacterium]|nr:hypothetical protein [Bdellovibrionales bacterium]